MAPVISGMLTSVVGQGISFSTALPGRGREILRRGAHPVFSVNHCT